MNDIVPDATGSRRREGEMRAVEPEPESREPEPEL
jgi:hypothetical protein